MAGVKVGIDGLADAVKRELDLYDKRVNEGIRKQVDKSMRQLVQETKGTTPTRRPKYKNQIASKVTNDSKRAYEKTWYVKGSEYRLSHLLNNGHALRNGGRAAGTQFITKASISVKEDFERKVEEVLRDGK